MANNIKQELEKIDLPKELHQRSISGIKQAKVELAQIKNRKTMNQGGKKMKKGIIAAAAAFTILGASWGFGGAHLASAGQTLIDQIFGSKEELKKADPIASDADLKVVESELEVAEKVLSKEEFNEYTALFKELTGYMKKVTYMENGVRKQNLDLLTKEEQNRLKIMEAEFQKYEKQIMQYARENHIDLVVGAED